VTSTPEHARLETRSVQSPVWARNKELPQPIRAKIEGTTSAIRAKIDGGKSGLRNFAELVVTDEPQRYLNSQKLARSGEGSSIKPDRHALPIALGKDGN